MSKERTTFRSARGLSSREMIFVFLGGIALCAVFFSLGFLVGLKERELLPSWERVGTSPSMPPLGEAAASGEEPAAGADSQSGKLPLSFNAPEQSKIAAVRLEKPDSVSGSSPSGSSAPARESPPKGTPVRSGYAVQVAALRAEKDVEVLLHALKAKDYPVFIVHPQYAEGRDKLFRVQVGPFATREKAEVFRKKLAQEGFEPFIRQ